MTWNGFEKKSTELRRNGLEGNENEMETKCVVSCGDDLRRNGAEKKGVAPRWNGGERKQKDLTGLETE